MATRRKKHVDALVTALGAIAVSGGYNTNVATAAGGGGAQRVKRANLFEKLPVLIVSLDNEEPNEDRTQLYEPIARGSVACIVADDGSTDPDDLTEAILEDVEKVLLAQDALDPILGVPGTVRLKIEGHSKYPIEAGKKIGAELRISVRYRHDALSTATYAGSSS